MYVHSGVTGISINMYVHLGVTGISIYMYMYVHSEEFRLSQFGKSSQKVRGRINRKAD